MSRVIPLHRNILLGIFLVIHILIFLHLGIRDFVDSNIYIAGADFLLSHRYLEHDYHIFYFVPIAAIAIFRWMFSEQMLSFLIFQCIVSAMAVLCLYLSASKIFKNSWAGFMSAFILLMWLDIIQWNTAVMTESLFCSFTCFVIYVLSRFTGSVKDYLMLLVLLTLVFFTRPTGIVIIIGTIAFMLHYYWPQIKIRPILQVLILTGLLVACFISAFLMFSLWNFTEQYRKGNIVTYMDVVDGTQLYHSSLRLNTEGLEFMQRDAHPLVRMMFFITHNPWHFTKAGFLKVWYLLSFVRPYYSWGHNVYSITWLSLIYTLVHYGTRLTSNTSIRYFVFTVIIVNCSLITTSTVDWDNRFYIPMAPGIVLLAGGGATAVIKRFRKKLIYENRFLHS